MSKTVLEQATTGFVKCCEIMKKHSILEKQFPTGGVIKLTNESCQNCAQIGWYYGYRLDYGRIYEVMNAKWCPHCSDISKWTSPYNHYYGIPEKEILSIMRAKLLTSVIYFDDVESDKPCPECGDITFKHSRSDVATSETTDTIWRVCIKPECLWSGEYLTETLRDF